MYICGEEDSLAEKMKERKCNVLLNKFIDYCEDKKGLTRFLPTGAILT